MPVVFREKMSQFENQRSVRDLFFVPLSTSRLADLEDRGRTYAKVAGKY